MIELLHMSAGYGRQVILKDISAVFEKGKITCIIGPNGSGKSTLLKALVGVLPDVNGQILLDGAELKRMDAGSIARKIAYLAQGRSVPDMSVEQLVLHGRFPYLSYPRRYRKQDREIAVQAMQQMGIEDLAEKKLTVLSGGMRQSAYIAMALAQSTDYILLDEPTTYLDIANQMQLMKTLKELAENGKGIIAVLHDLTLAMEYADRILLLKDGIQMMDAVPDAVLKSGIIQDVYGVSLKRTTDGHYYYDTHNKDT